MKTYKGFITKISGLFAGLLLIGLLAACGDTTTAVDTSIPLPTVTPIGSATPVLGLETATVTPNVAQFAPSTQVVTAQPVVVTPPMHVVTAGSVNPPSNGNENNNNGSDKGKGKDNHGPPNNKCPGNSCGKKGKD